MASKETLVAQRGGQRASATKFIENARLEMDKEVTEFEILDSIYNKLSKKLEKLNKIKQTHT